ncbi:hypothetical protein VIGAN_08096900 [Vigna angularis var. angularis]|uniref:Uncharacterized protein n=1 Tax=Vigna angularis var. angularis TaxID=157739 RepID=A0A0S3SNK2_PHAAN|nr:hypothetical protein VIGAN_08096900 [Vigna angularis var. angularis]
MTHEPNPAHNSKQIYYSKMVLTWTPAQICEENKRGTRAKHRGMAETKDREKKREEGGGVGVGFHCCVRCGRK